MPVGPVTEMIQKNSGTQIIDWKDAISTVEATDTPFLALLPEGKKPAQIETNWPASKIEVGEVGAAEDGADVSDADYRYQGRVPLKSVSQEVRDAWKVTNQAEETQTAGVKDEVSYQKGQSLLRLRLKLERLFLANQDAARAGVDKATKNKTRSVGKWLEPLATGLNAQYPIPDGFRIAAACKFAGALSTLSDTAFEAMLQAAANQRMKVLDLDLFGGLKLRAHMADWLQHDSHVTTTNGGNLSVNIDAEKMSYLKKVEFFTFEAGYVRSHTNFNLFYDLATGLPTTQTSLGGFALDMSNGWEIRFMKKITNKNLPDLGGGPRGLWLTIVLLACQLPVGQLHIAPSGA